MKLFSIQIIEIENYQLKNNCSMIIGNLASHFSATCRRPCWRWPPTTGSSTATVGSAFLSVRTIQYKLNRAQGRELALSLFALSLFRSSFFRSSLFRSLLCRSLLCCSLLYRFFLKSDLSDSLPSLFTKEQKCDSRKKRANRTFASALTRNPLGTNLLCV